MGAENLAPQRDLIPRAVQPVASRYTDWAIPAHTQVRYMHKMQHAINEYIYGIEIFNL